MAKLLAVILPCAVLAGSVAASGCMGAGDIYAGPSKALVAGYCLQHYQEFGDYRLEKCVGEDNPVGIFDGTLEKIGWNKRYIVGWRTPANGGERAGWMILDTSDGQIEGPFSQSAFDSLEADRAGLRGIVTSPCRDVLK